MPLFLRCPLLNYHRIGNQLLLNLNGKKPWLRRWELWKRMALGSSFLLHLGRKFLDLNEFVLLNRKLMWWTIERYKARLVAKGFTRTYGIWLLRKFCACCKIKFYWCVIVLCSNLGWSLQQLDVTNAFLLEAKKKKYIWKCLQVFLMKLQKEKYENL